MLLWQTYASQQQLQNSHSHCLTGVDVTGNNRMTTSTQLHPENASSTLKEEDTKNLPSSTSSEIFFSHSTAQQHSNFTHANIERHANQHRSAR
jgi:hypothetical protein